MPRVPRCDVNLRKIVRIDEQSVLVEWSVEGRRNTSGTYRWILHVTRGQEKTKVPLQLPQLKVGLFMARLRFDPPEKMDFLWSRVDELLA